MTNPKNPLFKYRRAWSFPSHVEAKMAELMEGFTLHVCSGSSGLGDVRVDLHTEANIKGDMYRLPFRRETFDTVLCDPPWNLPYHVRFKLLYELRDVLKPGGRLVFNSLWFPRVRGLEVDPVTWIGVPGVSWRNVSLIFTARRSSLPTR